MVQFATAVYNFDRIKEDIAELSGFLEIETIAYDPFQATHLATQLMAEGYPVSEYRNVVMTMSDPMKTLDAWIIDKKLRHGCDERNPMTWMMSNVVSRVDTKDNIFPVKERAENESTGPSLLSWRSAGRWQIPKKKRAFTPQPADF